MRAIVVKCGVELVSQDVIRKANGGTKKDDSTKSGRHRVCARGAGSTRRIDIE